MNHDSKRQPTDTDPISQPIDGDDPGASEAPTTSPGAKSPKGRAPVWFLCLIGACLLAFGAWLLISRPAPPKVKPTATAQEAPATAPAASGVVPPEKGFVNFQGKFQPADTAYGPSFESPAAMTAAAEKHLRKTGPTTVEVGDVRIDSEQRELSFPATFDLRVGILEYALVHETGKVHEALLQTAVPAKDIHVAALLLKGIGLQPEIEVSWRRNGGESRRPIADFIEVREAAADTVTTGHWLYNGSTFSHGGFAASREGSIIALIGDSSALVNHSKTADIQRKDAFRVRTSSLPQEGSPVTIHLRFPSAEKH